MKTAVPVFMAIASCALIYADDAAANRGHAFARSGGVVSAPGRAFVSRPAFAGRPAFVARRAFIARPFVRAPFPRARFFAAPVVFFAPPPVYYPPPVAYYPDEYAPSYSSPGDYAPPAAAAPQYAPPAAVQPQPPVAQAPAYEYFCPDTRQYYPDATECASGWLTVVPDHGSVR